MAQKIVGKFNKNLEKIEFYEIIEDYKHYTIIKKQGTNMYYMWDNKNSLLSDELHMPTVPKDKKDYVYIMDAIKTWYIGVVFFWADSKFVTEYGLPNYDKLVSLYRELINIKGTEIQILNTLMEVKENEGFLNYLKCKAISFRFLRAQKKTIRKLEKEFKLVW